MFKKTRHLSILLLVFLLAFAPNDAQKANEAYRQGDYARAAELYQNALESDPENPRLHFNLGNTLAKLGRTEEAVQAYERFKSLTDDPRQHALAEYNIGKLYSDSEELDKAADHFKNALHHNPDDPDTRHNYELALRRQQQQEQQNQQQDQNQDQENEDDQDQDQDQNQNQSGQDDQQEQNEEQDQNQENPEPESGDQQESDSQPRPTQMSLEEAESILEALEQRERELIRNRKKEAEEEPSSNEKDW